MENEEINIKIEGYVWKQDMTNPKEILKLTKQQEDFILLREDE